MAETINCTSCGASNQLPEGKNSMFCAFCGNVIEKKYQLNESRVEENLIKAKPEIIENYLTLKYRKINSIIEVISWFSDSELDDIINLDLSNNNISSLDGLLRFQNLQVISLNNNKFENITDNELQIINSISLLTNNEGIRIELKDNPFKSFDWLEKIDYAKILNTYVGQVEMNYATFNTYIDPHYDFVSLCIWTNERNLLFWHPKSSLNKQNNKISKQGNCFIATATMGSYDHPEVIELRYFRDNWILKKKWGASFVEWYYHYGPIAAKSIEKSFMLKKICYLLIVKPLIYLSRIVK